MFKEQIEAVMAQRGVTKSELARRLGTKRQYINSMLKNKSFEKIQILADAIGCDAAELFQRPAEINGYIEYGGKIYRIKNMKDFKEISNLINNTNE